MVAIPDHAYSSHVHCSIEKVPSSLTLFTPPKVDYIAICAFANRRFSFFGTLTSYFDHLPLAGVLHTLPVLIHRLLACRQR